MAASTTPRNPKHAAAGDSVGDCADDPGLLTARRVAVAVSGGRDSLALLHATARAAERLGIELHALHVHHGLQPAADEWAAHVARCCRNWSRRWPIAFHLQRLEARPRRGDSVEAWARRERYAALEGMAGGLGVGLVLLAQHAQDQAETFMLQALRGAGAAGLAAMPRLQQRRGITWARPWLAQPRAAIDAYVRRHRIRAVEDPSNADLRFARSRLRQQVMPALLEAFPHAIGGLAAAAAQAASSRELQDEIAAIDLRAVADGERLGLRRWLALSPARRLNLLRAWLGSRLPEGATQTLLARLANEWREGSRIHAQCGALELRSHRGWLEIVDAPKAATVRATAPAGASVLQVEQPGDYPVAAWRRVLRVAEVATNDGVPLALLARSELHARHGGERWQRAPGSPPRSLKKAWQAAGVPPWRRDAPLLYAQQRIVFVDGLGLDARARALPGMPRVTLAWLPMPDEGGDEAAG